MLTTTIFACAFFAFAFFAFAFFAFAFFAFVLFAVTFVGFIFLGFAFLAAAETPVLRTAFPLARAMVTAPCRESSAWCRSAHECAPAPYKDGNPPDAARCTPRLPCRLPPALPRRGCACPCGPTPSSSISAKRNTPADQREIWAPCTTARPDSMERAPTPCPRCALPCAHRPLARRPRAISDRVR